MKSAQSVWRGGAWDAPPDRHDFQVALVFSSPAQLLDEQAWAGLRAALPATRLVGCSTAGEIAGLRIYDDAIVVTGLTLEHGHFEIATAEVAPGSDSAAIGAALGRDLPKPGLVHVLLLSEGLAINGSALAHGMTSALPHRVGITGGLSADGPRFGETVVRVDGGTLTHQVVAIGMYSERLRVGYGSVGGWDPFGPERIITRSRGNVLEELDGTPALDLYKRYLGKDAHKLPASGLAFPLAIRRDGTSEAVVRTVLNVDEAARSLTFAGDLPQGYRARLMHANVERLVNGASLAARESVRMLGGPPELALLISCVGRRLVLKQRAEEEVDAASQELGALNPLCGFYSYGELSPSSATGGCSLHNQTMTVTAFSEA